MGGLSQNQKPAGGLGALQQLPQQQQQANNVMTNNSGENAVCGLDYFYSEVYRLRYGRLVIHGIPYLLSIHQYEDSIMLDASSFNHSHIGFVENLKGVDRVPEITVLGPPPQHLLIKALEIN